MLELIFGGLEAFGTIIGAYLIVHQIKLTRETNIENNLIKKKETTLNAYNVVSDNLRKHNMALKTEFHLKGKDSLTEKDMLTIQNNPELLKHVNYIFDYLSRFAIGVKDGIYDIDTLYNISGRSFIRTFDRYYPYVEYMRTTYTKNIYTDTELFIEELRNRFINKGEKYFENK